MLLRHSSCEKAQRTKRETRRKGKKERGLKKGRGKKGCCPNELSFCGARAGAKTSICLFAAHLSSESCARILWAPKSHSDPLLSMVDGIWLPLWRSAVIKASFLFLDTWRPFRAAQDVVEVEERRGDNKRVSTLQNERQMTVIRQLAISAPRFNICMTRPDQNRCNHDDQRDSSKEPIGKFV